MKKALLVSLIVLLVFFAACSDVQEKMPTISHNTQNNNSINKTRQVNTTLINQSISIINSYPSQLPALNK